MEITLYIRRRMIKEVFRLLNFVPCKCSNGMNHRHMWHGNYICYYNGLHHWDYEVSPWIWDTKWRVEKKYETKNRLNKYMLTITYQELKETLNKLEKEQQCT